MKSEFVQSGIKLAGLRGGILQIRQTRLMWRPPGPTGGHRGHRGPPGATSINIRGHAAVGQVSCTILHLSRGSSGREEGQEGLARGDQGWPGVPGVALAQMGTGATAGKTNRWINWPKSPGSMGRCETRRRPETEGRRFIRLPSYCDHCTQLKGQERGQNI